MEFLAFAFIILHTLFLLHFTNKSIFQSSKNNNSKPYPNSAAMYRPNSSNQSFFNNQPIPGYSVPPVSHTDEELCIPQQRLPNSREMQEALRIEIEKEMRRCREIELQISKQVGATVSPPVLRFFAPPQDDGMSVEEKLARDCEEKRLVEKAAAARRRRYGG